MAKPRFIELPGVEPIPILYEDRSVIAIDKPSGWMLVPHTWQQTDRNLQAAITSSIAAGDFWARSRNLKFLRHIHRLDADTSGILLLAKSMGAVDTFGDLFERRQMEKVYLAVVHGRPQEAQWSCTRTLAPDRDEIGRMKLDGPDGKEAETHFRVLQPGERTSLVEARPVTGRTHQIRVHLAVSGHPVVGDPLYGPWESAAQRSEMGLRAVSLTYADPFTRQRVRILAAREEFLRAFGFDRATAKGPPVTTKPPVPAASGSSSRPVRPGVTRSPGESAGRTESRRRDREHRDRKHSRGS